MLPCSAFSRTRPFRVPNPSSQTCKRRRARWACKLPSAGGLMSYGLLDHQPIRTTWSASIPGAFTKARNQPISRPAGHQIRASHQPQDRQGAWPYHPGNAFGDRRRSDLMSLPRRRFCTWRQALSRSRRCRAWHGRRPIRRGRSRYRAGRPGGPTDTIARVLAERMRASLGQIIVVENASGAAGGSVSVGRVARATSDGYTVVVGHWQTHVGTEHHALQYDVLNDFEPISLIADGPQLIISKNFAPDEGHGGFDRLVKGQSQSRAGGLHWFRQSFTHCWSVFAETHRHPISVCALSRWGSGNAGLVGRAVRFVPSPMQA